jgi:hypothetical protein
MSHDEDPTAAAAATSHAGLSATGPQLIGTFHLQSGPRALVRLPGGRVRTLVPGSRLDGATVTAIGDTAIYLSRNGVETVLSLPAG